MSRWIALALGLGGCSVLNPLFEPEGEGASSTGTGGGPGPGPGVGPEAGSDPTTGPDENPTTEPDESTTTHGDESTSSGEVDQPLPFCDTVVWASSESEWLHVLHTETWVGIDAAALPVEGGISAIASVPATGNVWAFGGPNSGSLAEFDPHEDAVDEHFFDPPVPKEPITRAGTPPNGKDVYFMHLWDPGLYRLTTDDGGAYWGTEVMSLAYGESVNGDLAQGPAPDQLLLVLESSEVKHVDLVTEAVSEPSLISAIAPMINLTGLAHFSGRRYWASTRSSIYELEYRPGDESDATVIMIPKPLPELGDLAPAYLRDAICDQITNALEE